MEFDHVALSVKNVYESVRMYQSKFGAVIEYEDSTWAMISMGGIKVALTESGQHPPHIAFKVASLNDFPDGCEVKQHRDGSWYYYDSDADGNVIEWIAYPKS